MKYFATSKYDCAWTGSEEDFRPDYPYEEVFWFDTFEEAQAKVSELLQEFLAPYLELLNKDDY